MKIGKLHIYWGDDDLVDFVSIILFGRIMSRLDLERIKKYADGGHHVHKNPRKKPLFNLPPPKEEGEKDENHAALPRHTPEELDRLIEAVRKVESP